MRVLHNVHVVQAVADAVTSSVLRMRPSPRACLSLSTDATTDIVATGKLENLHDRHHGTSFDCYLLFNNYIIN